LRKVGVLRSQKLVKCVKLLNFLEKICWGRGSGVSKTPDSRHKTPEIGLKSEVGAGQRHFAHIFNHFTQGALAEVVLGPCDEGRVFDPCGWCSATRMADKPAKPTAGKLGGV
jgi:hypothetical protein